MTIWDDPKLISAFLDQQEALDELEKNPLGIDRSKPFNKLPPIQKIKVSSDDLKNLHFMLHDFSITLDKYRVFCADNDKTDLSFKNEAFFSCRIENVNSEDEIQKLANFYAACSELPTPNYSNKFIESQTLNWDAIRHGIRKKHKNFKIVIKSGGKTEYTPPEGLTTIKRMLAKWNEFNEAEHTVPYIVTIALSHFQYESIHPLYDGNGRTGRAFAVDMFMKHYQVDIAPQISQYLSTNVAKHRYYDALSATRLKGEHSQMVLVFLEAFTEGMKISMGSLSPDP